MIRRPRDGPAGDVIRLRGVRQNNLQGIDLDIPLYRLTVVTGVSGSGKSSLAFDTLFAEGQRRYVETFSAYTRQFLDRLPRPRAASIEGVPPAVAIDQAGAIKTSRSTVGTLTGLNDYLKLLYARSAQASCPTCGRAIEEEGTEAALAYLRGLPAKTFPVLVVAPVPLGGFESREIIASALKNQGYVRYLRDGEVRRIDDMNTEDARAPSLSVVVDRLGASSSRARRADSVDQAFRAGRGHARLVDRVGARAFSRGFHCAGCDRELTRPSPGLFSFNTAYGACPECRGFGRTIGIDWGRVVPDETLSIREGAVRPWRAASRRGRLRKCIRACEARGVSVDVPWADLDADAKSFVLEGGTGGWDGVRGFFRKLEAKKYKMHVRVLLSRYRGYFTCPRCDGGRLRSEALCFRVGGLTLPEFWALPAGGALEVVERLLRGDLSRAARLVADEVASRLRYLVSVGLGYLSLDRQSRTLSGGEVERVNLTAALGACLVDTLFVLDEPSIGLHARDNERLLHILRQVKSRGNTVVVVEHDPEILRAADHIVDLGPGSGRDGGRVVATGTVDEVAAYTESVTGAYLDGRRSIPRRGERRSISPRRVLRIRGASENNLRSLDVDIPLDVLTVITGVSGSGKSTLLNDVVWRAYLRRRGEAVEGDVRVRSVEGFDRVDEVVLVDQTPIGRTPRGNPATYTKLFASIRTLFASTSEARARGWESGAFSFNVAGGRCSECDGAGAKQVEMQFLSDITLPCEACDGKRFRDEILQVRYRSRNIHEVLELTIRDAMAFFEGHVELVEKLSFLDGLGLGYLRLGQPINTLSGGEAQRLKLAGRVMASGRGRLLFLLDEPTTGLHLEDVRGLLDVLDGLVERGHGVVVIEHHLDVIARADHVIDLGPEGGDGGGDLVVAGTPEDVAKEERSITGSWIRDKLVPCREGRVALSGPFARGARGAPSGKRVPARRRNDGAPTGRPVVRVVGARENNLRDIQVELPRNRLVVVTGLSGAGKSSLVYDIIFAEGQRRYLDCLSPYARQFVEDLHRPDIDHLEGIPPAVAIEQRTSSGGRKSTAGTVTEVYHFLRLLYTRAGVQYCPDCGVEVAPRSRGDVRREVARLARRGGWLLAPVVRGKKGFHSRLLASARRRGVLDARIDGEWVAIPEHRELRLERNHAHDIDLVTGRFRKRSSSAAKVDASLALGLELAGGVVRYLAEDGEETIFNLHRSCPSCRTDFQEPEPHNFSFHSRRGACPECDGYGGRLEPDPVRCVTRWDVPPAHHPAGPLSLLDARPFRRGARKRFLSELSRTPGLPLERPLAKWSQRALGTLLEGNGRGGGFAGLSGAINTALENAAEAEREAFLAAYGTEVPCRGCGGTRLDAQWAAVKVGGRGIGEVSRLTVDEIRRYVRELPEDVAPPEIVSPILEEIDSRLEFLQLVGLDYLTLDRGAHTLSGGEAQRIRLAAQLGSNLRGACYILDEPTIGLHSRDNARLLDTLRRLRDRGNSVLVIEHDDATIEAADEVLELGPGPGHRGGEVVAQGTLEDVIAAERSPTGEYFRERARRRIALAADTLQGHPVLAVKGATLHNLQRIHARFPLGAVTAVTGVSGAGKSTLVRDVLEESARRHLRGDRRAPPGAGSLAGSGWDQIEAVREVNQRPIGRTPRSTPATYVGFWDAVRRIFAALPTSRARGYSERRFSFNVSGGRCESCAGQGRIRIEMSFLPDVTTDCEACRGARFGPETLEVTYHGKSIADVLSMAVEEALEFFGAYRELTRPLKALDDLGLGYLTLGQPSPTLSGGEAQRVKLAVELSKTAGGACLYLFDEPTTGLHMKDVGRLVEVLRRLSRAGHAVVTIEHNLEVIAGADWVVDLGPEGGAGGGKVLYEGPVRGLLASRRSHTAKALEVFLAKGSRK